MRNYVYKTRLSAERQKELFWFCRQYSRFKGELHSTDSATRERAQRNLRELDFCFLAIGSRDDLSGSTIKALRENICDGIGYDKMRDRPPCGKNQFYKLRKEFYELLDENHRNHLCGGRFVRCHQREMSGMRNYVYKTRLSAEQQKELFWFCRQYSRFKGELHSTDSATRERAQRNLRELNFCFLAIGSRDDLSGGTVRALRQNICEGIGYDRMRDRPPCGKNQFYKLRKEFYELLDERMKQAKT